MLNSVVYLTRRCPQKCDYCSLQTSPLVRGKELEPLQWIEILHILKEMGVTFNLFLGNECWLLGKDLLTILEKNTIPYALYTTCPPGLFERYRDEFLGSGLLDNVSCGIDYPLSYLEWRKENGYSFNDMELKSYNAWKGLIWVKEYYPKVDVQSTITVSKMNYIMLYHWIEETREKGIFGGVNYIHYDKGGFDFFPPKDTIKDLIFGEKDLSLLKIILDDAYEKTKGGILQNPEFLKLDVSMIANMKWHCKGNPYGGPTVDADGSLRVCGYRKGKRTPQLSIFDLPQKKEQWKEVVYQDAMECSGCVWSMPWLYHHWMEKSERFGEKVFNQHAGEHIDKNLWSERRIK